MEQTFSKTPLRMVFCVGQPAFEQIAALRNDSGSGAEGFDNGGGAAIIKPLSYEQRIVIARRYDEAGTQWSFEKNLLVVDSLLKKERIQSEGFFKALFRSCFACHRALAKVCCSHFTRG